jgi:hypothetical protein
MLASITPFGERGRHNRWSTTVTAYVAASTGAGAAAGALLGLAGGTARALAHPGPVVIGGLAAAGCAIAAALDLHLGGLRLPTWRRQVNEDWLQRYRGWVYGAGFGAQLGVGVVTIVTTAAVYATLLLAVLSGSAAMGAVIGAVFGAVRAVPVIGLAGVVGPEQLRRAHRRMIDLSRPVERATIGLLLLAAALASVAARV